MNIFVTDFDPTIAAHNLCDKHVIKMVLESTMLLSNVMHKEGFTNPPCKLAFSKHPCSVWAGKSIGNYCWLYDHNLAICKEFENRYGHSHSFVQHLPGLNPAKLWHIKEERWPMTLDDYVDLGFDDFCNCTPYKEMPNVVEAYRKYYIEAKSKFATWKKTEPPDWYLKGLTETTPGWYENKGYLKGI